MLLLPGCALLNWSSAWLATKDSVPLAETPHSPLKKIPTSKSAVTLEIIFVERPADDPLLGNQLWDEVDQIGSLVPADRDALAKIGFRVGRVGANPPRALQTLMGLSTEVASEEDKRLVGRRVVLPSGAETEIATGMPEPAATIKLPAKGDFDVKSFENVRGVFRMKAKRLQDGWVRVEFLPEIHHGRVTNRPVAPAGRWQNNTAQAIERLYHQKFTLDLNLGEMVVLTGEAEPADSVGRHFFYASNYSDSLAKSQFEALESGMTLESVPVAGGPGIQRLLIVRLADIATAESIYAGQ
jgi:hypothetical protein